MPLEAIELPEPRLEPPAALAEICSSERYERVSHALGKAYRDVVRGLRGQIDEPGRRGRPPARRGARSRRCSPGARTPARPAIPTAAARASSAGSSRGSATATRARSAIDLGALDRVLEVDPVSRAARIQAGTLGPSLEDQLGEHGLTLRHFPQSFEYSTLGGWIATRAGGHFATSCTHIDDLVESVRAITPSGEWESRRLPGLRRRARAPTGC